MKVALSLLDHAGLFCEIEKQFDLEFCNRAIDPVTIFPHYIQNLISNLNGGCF